jgi:hypothetical protein
MHRDQSRCTHVRAPSGRKTDGAMLRYLWLQLHRHSPSPLDAKGSWPSKKKVTVPCRGLKLASPICAPLLVSLHRHHLCFFAHGYRTPLENHCSTRIVEGQGCALDSYTNAGCLLTARGLVTFVFEVLPKYMRTRSGTWLSLPSTSRQKHPSSLIMLCRNAA